MENNYLVTRYLNEMKHRLLLHSTNGEMTEEDRKPLPIFIKLKPIIDAHESLRTSGVRKLCGVVDYILANGNIFRRRSSDFKDGWPGGLNYESQTIRYQYLGFTYGMSVMADDETYYVSLSLRKDPQRYIVKPISSDCIPSFNSSEQNEDEKHFGQIRIVIEEMISNFCQKIAQLRPKQEDSRVLFPIKQDLRKRKALDSPDHDDDEEGKEEESSDDEDFDEPQNEIYEKLKELKENCAIEPSEKSILFATIHVLLTHYRPFYANFDWDGQTWPVSLTFNKEVLMYTYANKLMNVSLIHNDESYFLVMKVFSLPNKFYLKKISSHVIPKFTDAEKLKDLIRIAEIEIWLNSFFKKFAEKIHLRSPRRSASSAASSSTRTD